MRCLQWALVSPRQGLHRAWSGQSLGLRRLSLRYATPGREGGFVRKCSDRLCVQWYFFTTLYVLVSVYWLAWEVVPYGTLADQSGPVLRVLLARFSMRLACTLAALAHVVVMSVPRLLAAVSAPVREAAVLALLSFGQLTAFDNYYMSKICGFPDPVALFPELEVYADSLMLLHLSIYLVTAHFLPLRWYRLVAFEVLTVAIYGLCIFYLGTPEPHVSRCFSNFLIVVLVVSVGKRHNEVNERLVFSSFLAEKSLRLQAEFQLSRALPARRDEDDNAGGSCATTSVTGEVFNGLGSSEEPGPSLETIWEIGRKEQWLIDEEELGVYPYTCLGSGGFGTVIAAEYNRSPAAVKLSIRGDDAKMLLDIGNELRLLRRLRHPNIVLFHGACLSKSKHELVLVLERLSGESLALFIAGEPAVLQRRKALMDVCHALLYLHTRKPLVVHGDLKPGNIIVDGRAEVVHAKLLDFGLARLLTRSAQPGGGTFRWMAPGVLGPGGGVRAADDVFAFGLIIYFAATGKKPFEGETDRNLRAHAHGETAGMTPLDWPREASPFAAECRPLADLCVEPHREGRPSMGRASEVLRGGGGGQEGSGGPFEPPHADLWRGLALAREIAKHRQSSKLARPLLEEQWEWRVAGPGFPASRPVGGSDGGPGPPPDTAVPCRFRGLHPTPPEIMLQDLTECIMQWNWPLEQGVCCEYHAALKLVSQMSSALSIRGCAQPKGDPGTRTYQCPSCQRLIYEDGDSCADFHCFYCGYAGPPGLYIQNPPP